MKKIQFIIAILTCVLCAPAVMAQDDIQKVQDAWGMDKKELVRIGMSLSAADSVKFWPVYDQYEVARKKIGRDRILILNDYAENYSTITNAKADELMQRLFKNSEALSKLHQQYYGKVKTALNAMQAAKFVHIESYLQSTISSQVQGALPVIGQLDSLKTNK